MNRRRILILALLVMVSALPLFSASAGINNGAAFTLDCAGFTGTGGDILLDRDNTDDQRESFILSVTDGAGNVIYEPVVDQFFIGGTVSWTGEQSFAWTQTPQYNPLTLRVVSQSGNGFDEQEVTLATGSCEGLPGYGALPEGFFLTEEGLLTDGKGGGFTLGDTSPAVGPNGVPPRGDNLDEVIEQLFGYLIVNTDNLSVRSGDGPEYTMVGIVDGGTRLVPLGRNEDFTWWYVQAGDVIGWSKAEFLIARGDLTDVPVVESQGDITQPRLFLFVDLPLLASPNERALPLCTIEGDQEYLVVGRDDAIEWYEVQSLCNSTVVKGWVPAEQGGIRNPAELFIPVTTE